MAELSPTPAPASSAPAAISTASDEADELVASILTASRLLVAVSARSLASVEENLTLPQFRMLVVLDSREAMSISRLADFLAVNPSTAMRMVDRLAVAGMVARSSNPDSRREVLVTCTPTGSTVVREVTQRRTREIAGIVAEMPARRRKGLADALRAFAEAGGEPSASAKDVLPGWH